MDVRPGPQAYEFGDFRLDVQQQALVSRASGESVPLTARVFDTLLYFVEHAQELVNKHRLMKAVWPHVVVEENNLDQSISVLRRLLGEHRGDNRYILTVRGRGYRFVAPVAVIDPGHENGDSGVTSAAESKTGLSATAAGAATPQIGLTGLAVRRLRVAGGLAAMAGIIGLGVYWLLPPVTPPVPFERTLAVLPFKPMVLAERSESLEMGMTDTLVAVLGAGSELAVAPLSSVRRYGGLEQDAAAAGRALNVATVLDGHIQRDGDRLRVSARLINATDGKQLWSQRFDQQFTDIFAVQDAIAARVRDALRIELGNAPARNAQRGFTADAEAYQFYVNGRFLRNRASEESLRQAIAQYEQAIERDPRFALAYVGLADSHAILGVFGAVAPDEAFPRAKEAVLKALALDPELGEAYASLGHIRTQYELDWAGAHEAYRRSIELNPNYGPGQQWLGHLLAYEGDIDAGIAQLRKAQAIEPLSPSYGALIGLMLNYARRYDEAVVQLQRTLASDPAFDIAHTYLGLAYLRRDQYELADAHLKLARSPTPGSASYPGQILALSGRRAEALAEAARLQHVSATRHVPAYDIAGIYAVLGEADRTFEWLERAVDERSQLLGWLRHDAAFDGVRADPRYAQIVRRIGLTEGRSPALAP